MNKNEPIEPERPAVSGAVTGSASLPWIVKPTRAGWWLKHTAKPMKYLGRKHGLAQWYCDECDTRLDANAVAPTCDGTGGILSLPVRVKSDRARLRGMRVGLPKGESPCTEGRKDNEKLCNDAPASGASARNEATERTSNDTRDE